MAQSIQSQGLTSPDIEVQSTNLYTIPQISRFCSRILSCRQVRVFSGTGNPISEQRLSPFHLVISFPLSRGKLDISRRTGPEKMDIIFQVFGTSKKRFKVTFLCQSNAHAASLKSSGTALLRLLLCLPLLFSIAHN